MMLTTKISIQLYIYIFLTFGINSIALTQPDKSLSLQGKISGEFRSNISRQPGLEKDEDYRLNLIFTVGKKWQLMSNRKISLSYDLKHYRYSDFTDFTRYDQTLWGQFVQRFGQNYKFTASDELRFRLHPSTKQFNYTKNISDFNLRRKVGSSNNLIIGYRNWLKTYHNNPSLSKYVSHRAYMKFNHEFSRRLNLGAKFEYQNHKGNLYAGSTAPQQALNVNGNRFMLRLNFDKLFSRKLVTSVSYKYELDLADDFDIEESDDDIDDEDAEEFLAEDSDFGYTKHQSSLSMHLKANRKISFLFFYLYYSKGFQYWRITPEGPKRQDNVLFFSHKISFKLSNQFGIDIRHNFEANRTNLNLYKYEINSVAVGLNFMP